MTTALDSSVLWAIIREEPGHEHWLQVLMQAASEGPLLISPIAFAELAPSTADEAELLALLARLAIGYDPIAPAAAHLAGLTFKRSSPPTPKPKPTASLRSIAVILESGFRSSSY